MTILKRFTRIGGKNIAITIFCMKKCKKVKFIFGHGHNFPIIFVTQFYMYSHSALIGYS